MFSAIQAFFASSQRYIFMGLGVLAVILIAAAGFYFWWSQNRIEELIAQKAALDLANKTLSVSLDTVNKDMESLRIRTDELNQKLAQIREEAAKRSRQVLKHDLDKIGQRKPQALENSINNQIREFNRRLEELSRQ